MDVVELHDCFSCNEMITYEALGLCEEGKAGEFIDSGAQTYGGKVVVNPSGGLISKGHPLGATGASHVLLAAAPAPTASGTGQVWTCGHEVATVLRSAARAAEPRPWLAT